MKTLTLQVLGLASAALTFGAPVLEERQSSMINAILSSATAFMPGLTGSVTTEKATLKKAGVMRHITRYGPFVLPAYKERDKKAGMEGMDMSSDEGKTPGLADVMSMLKGAKPMDPNGFGFAKKLTSGICKDCTVLKGRTSVNFEDGREAGIEDGVYIHHAILVDVTKPTGASIPGCPGMGGGISTFLGAGVDNFTQYYTTPDASFPSGFYVKDDNFIMQAEFVNYKATNQTVYVQVDMEYIPGKVGNDAAQNVLSATNCSRIDMAFKPKAGTAGELQSQDFEVSEDGTVVTARGHMHDGGTSVQMRINNQLVCSSNATYGGEGHTTVVDGKEWATITKMSECNEPIAVKRGDKVKIVATYDTAAHPARVSEGMGQEIMGIMTYVFVPRRESRWGAWVASWI